QGGVNSDGVYHITITATDADGATASDILDLTVTNPVPTVTAPLADVIADDSDVINIDAAAAFDDEDDLSFSAVGLPTGLSIDPVTGEITGTLQANASQGGSGANGIYTIVVTANDNE